MNTEMRAAVKAAAHPATRNGAHSARRYLVALAGDIRFQAAYGFYALYALISAVYAAVLLVCPAEYRRALASIVILTDPAMLGAFFIGGIWLLEKGEGLHSFRSISPLKPLEYALSKAVSLALISTLSGFTIAFAGLREGTESIDYLFLSFGIFIGTLPFTLIGLLIASYARSVNHYLLIASPPLVALLIPPIVGAFGISAPLLDLTPGMALWRVISLSLGSADAANRRLLLAILFAWLVLLTVLVCKRIPRALQGEE